MLVAEIYGIAADIDAAHRLRVESSFDVGHAAATTGTYLDHVFIAQVDGAGALWNGAYDAGLGVGGISFGALATGIGFDASFALAGLALALIAILTFRHFEAR